MERPKVTGTVADGTPNELSVRPLYSDSAPRESMVGIHGENGEIVAIISANEADRLARYLHSAAGHARGRDCELIYGEHQSVVSPTGTGEQRG